MTSRRGIRSSCYRHYHQLLRHTFCSFIQTVFPRKCPFHDLLTRADRESNVLWEESRYGLSFLRSLSSYSFLYQTPFHDDQRTEVGGDVKETRMLCLIVWTNFSSMGIISWLDISFFGESEVRTQSMECWGKAMTTFYDEDVDDRGVKVSLFLSHFLALLADFFCQYRRVLRQVILRRFCPLKTNTHTKWSNQNWLERVDGEWRTKSCV